MCDYQQSIQFGDWPQIPYRDHLWRMNVNYHRSVKILSYIPTRNIMERKTPVCVSLVQLTGLIELNVSICSPCRIRTQYMIDSSHSKKNLDFKDKLSCFKINYLTSVQIILKILKQEHLS